MRTYHKHILGRNSQTIGQRLSSPLMRRIDSVSGNEIEFGVQHPSNSTIIDGNTDHRTKDLGEKDGTGRDVHIVPNLLILKHDLSSVPGVSCYRTIKKCTDRVFITVYCINHQAVEKLICCSDGLFSVSKRSRTS
jgi:hypothetical protein